MDMRGEIYHVFSCPSSRHKEGFMDRGQSVNLLVCKFSKKIEILEREKILEWRENCGSHIPMLSFDFGDLKKSLT